MWSYSRIIALLPKTNTSGGHFHNAIRKTKALMVSIMRYVTLLHDDDQHLNDDQNIQLNIKTRFDNSLSLPISWFSSVLDTLLEILFMEYHDTTSDMLHVLFSSHFYVRFICFYIIIILILFWYYFDINLILF